MRLTLQRLLPDAILAAVAFGLTALYVAAAGGGFPLDDAWIHQTFGRNFAGTGIWAFYAGVPSTASTSPLYTLVLAAGYRLGIPYALWAHGMGALALALTGITARHMSLRLHPERKRLALVAGLAVVCAWHLIWAAASGMETALFSLLTLVLIGLAWRELAPAPTNSPRSLVIRALIFGAVAGGTILTRPEGAVLVTLIGISLLAARPNMTWAQVISWGSIALTVCVAVLVPYLSFNLAISQSLLPNTAAAKHAYAEPIRELGVFWGLRLMVLPLLAGGHVLLIPGMIVYGAVWLNASLHSRVQVLVLLPLVWGIGLIVLYAYWLPLNFQHGRYVIPALPSLIFCGVLGTDWLLRRARGSVVPRILTRVLAVAAVLVTLIFALVSGLAAYRLDVRVINDGMVASARWIAENLPPGELLAANDIGAVGYFAPREIVDIAGLISPEFIPHIHNPDERWRLMEAAGARYLMALPDQIPGGRTDDPRLCPLFTTEAEAASQAGGAPFTIYTLAWDRDCSNLG